MTQAANERLLACFWWRLSRFLTLTLGKLLITAYWVIDFEISAFSSESTFCTVGMEEEDGGGVRCYSMSAHSHFEDVVTSYMHVLYTKHVFLRRLKGNLGVSFDDDALWETRATFFLSSLCV